MKGKNKPSRRHRKKQVNIVEEKKPNVKQKVQEEVSERGSVAVVWWDQWMGITPCVRCACGETWLAIFVVV